METKFGLKLKGIPRELLLIIEMINQKKIDNIQISSNDYKDIDWKLFINLCIHHRLYPILASKLINVENGISIPSYVIDTMNQLYIRNTFHMLHLSREMEQVCKVFNEYQISLLVLKGPVLGADLYGDVSFRTSGDLDILIPIHKLNQADQILTSLGYEKDDYIKTVLSDWKWRHHHVTFFHQEKNVKLEIHWRLNPGPGKEPSFQELWDRRRKCSLTKYPVYYLGREDLFLFLVSHGARHGWSRLRWLLDINQMAGQNVDWHLLIKLLKKYQYFQIGGQAIILSSEIFNTSISKMMIPLINGEQPKKLAQSAIFYLEKMVNLHNTPLPRDVSLYHQRHLLQIMSKRQRFLFLMSYLYPYPEDAKTFPLPNNLHFLYFLLRPFLWAWRRGKHHLVS